MYLGTNCNIGSKRAFSTGVLERWHNCLLLCLFTDATSHSVPRPNRFVYFCVMTRQNVDGSYRRNLFFFLALIAKRLQSTAAPTKMLYYFQFCFSVRTCKTRCFTYCIRWGIVSRDSIDDSDWLRATDWCKSYPYDTIMIRSYGRREKDCGWASCTERTTQGTDFELILTVKMETWHPVVNFRRSVIIAKLWRPEVAKPGIF